MRPWPRTTFRWVNITPLGSPVDARRVEQRREVEVDHGIEAEIRPALLEQPRQGAHGTSGQGGGFGPHGDHGPQLREVACGLQQRDLARG